jgi:DNA primase
MIAQAQADAVRRRVDIVRAVSERVPLEHRGGDIYYGRCPFHRDEQPSLKVDRKRGAFSCGRCRRAGDVVTFVEGLDGLSYAQAVRKLATRWLAETEVPQ